MYFWQLWCHPTQKLILKIILWDNFFLPTRYICWACISLVRLGNTSLPCQRRAFVDLPPTTNHRWYQDCGELLTPTLERQTAPISRPTQAKDKVCHCLMMMSMTKSININVTRTCIKGSKKNLFLVKVQFCQLVRKLSEVEGISPSSILRRFSIISIGTDHWSAQSSSW